MSLPRNSNYFTAIKAGIAGGKDPAYMLYDPRIFQFDKKTKHHVSRMLLMAYQILKDETCPRCGIVVWHGRSTDNYVQFEEHTSRCESCVVEGTKSKNRKDTPGVTDYLTPYSVDPKEHPLPTRRAYHEQLIEDHRREAASKAAEAAQQEV